MFSLTDYTYTLPKELIAEEAIHPHHDARLMVLSRESGEIIEEAKFWDLPNFLEKDRILFFNNSRVQRARIRISGKIREKSDGKKTLLEDGEIFVLEDLGSGRFEALVRPGSKLKPGSKIWLDVAMYISIEEMTGEGRICQVSGISVGEMMETYGELPLPPYIEYSKEKEADYQTSFASKDGSVAAPTASLHFTNELLENIGNEKYFLTLHVGLGTFKGIDTDDIRDYAIHKEKAEVPLSIFEALFEMKNSGKKVVAVGTTACRTLESLPFVWKGLKQGDQSLFREEVQLYWNSMAKNIGTEDYIHSLTVDNTTSTILFSTAIYIYPGKSFHVVDELITNFHLPESSLLVLVSALMGKEKIMNIYRKAIEKKYRFFSFGDGMYIKI